MIPIFDGLLRHLPALPAILLHVTAPYDVPFARFSEYPSAAELWKAHVMREILSPWAVLPYFVCGFSGGTALALNGLQSEVRCFGGAILGADALPQSLACPKHWAEKLRVYIAPNDPVCQHPANRRQIETLQERGEIEVFHLHSGGHRLVDYTTPECLGDVIQFASRIVPARAVD